MKATQEMIDLYGQVWEATPAGEPGARRRAALQAVLDLIGIEPFSFGGAEHLVTYIHPPCGTVEPADPAYAGDERSMMYAITEGLCDCERTAPWRRIYVIKEGK